MPMRPGLLSSAGKILTIFTLFAALATFAFYAHALFLQYPPVWPDEALYANPAIELLRHGTFGTTLFEGILPGVAKHTYLQPPLYGLCLWAVFKAWGVGIVLARFVSTLAAVAVLLLTYKVGLQSGLNRWLALLPVAMLATDTVFLRGALIARMDMLALGFILLALYLGVDSSSRDGFPGKRKSFLAGVVCGLAALTHPFGVVASVALVLWQAFAGRNCRWRILPFLLAGIFAPLACWGAYIAQDRRSFIVQFGAQLTRKVSRNPLTIHGLYPALKTYLLQYGEPSLLILLAWILGLTGLWLAARRQKYVLPLLLCGIATVVLMIWSDEMWYGLYLLPLTMIGLVHLAGLAARSEFPWERAIPRKIFGWLAILLSLWWAQKSLVQTWSANYVANTLDKHRTDYAAWCNQISSAIPNGSTVLISAIPDPYFKLNERQDLILRQFITPGFPATPGERLHYLESVDYIVTFGALPSQEVWNFVRTHGELVKEVGAPFGAGYYARIYKVKKSE